MVKADTSCTPDKWSLLSDAFYSSSQVSEATQVFQNEIF